MRRMKERMPAPATMATLVAAALLWLPGEAPAQTPSSQATPVAPSPRATPDLAAFTGLGVWIDIYDPWAFADPVKAVSRAKKHDVNTIFVETSNYSRDFSVYRPMDMARLIHAAHVRGMKVVAWYLPSLYHPAFDYKRSMAAIGFHRNGQRFDGFGLDIEYAGVRPEKVRNDRLISLSKRLDGNTTAAFPLSAIIPSPLGMQLVKGYWEHFPYDGIAPYYDVWQPMTYYTYRVKGRQAVYDYTHTNADILHTETGDPNLPIHQIGGIASQSSGLETGGFVDAILDDGLMGGSIYDMGLSGPEDWRELHRLVP